MRGEPRDLRAWLTARGLLAGDGAMGTALLATGLVPGASPERLNIEKPRLVEAVHRAAVEAGAEILQTNSFGGSPARLAEHGLAGAVAPINRAAAALARAVAGDRALVAGSMGPTGWLLDPLGPLDPGEAEEGFAMQAAALAEGGCDFLAVETMSDLREAALAVKAAAATGLPVFASLAFESTPGGTFTIFGVSPAEAAATLEAGGATGLGANCGPGPADTAAAIRELRAATTLPLCARPNAGRPVATAVGARYLETPETMAAHAGTLVEAGAAIVGGCCGTDAGHVRAMASALRRLRASR